MRTARDRVRHAILFEIIGLALITPLSALVFHHPIEDMGVIAVVSATIAMLWNYAYNWGFDVVLQRRTGGTHKTVPVRVVHAVLFELGLLILLIPMIAWYLQLSLFDALLMDIAIAGFYVVYAFVFNWAYDRMFPLPEWREA